MTTILVVHQDTSVLAVLGRLLRQQGYEIAFATSMHMAIAIAPRQSIHLALVDSAFEASATQLYGVRMMFITGVNEAEVIRIKALDRGIGLPPDTFGNSGLLGRVNQIVDAATNGIAAQFWTAGAGSPVRSSNVVGGLL